MDRRTFLETSTMGLLGLASGCSKTTSDHRSKSSASSSLSPTVTDRSHYTLQQLVQEVDEPTTGYKGFPTLIQEAGFKLSPISIRTDSRQQVVIIGEQHGTSTSQIVELVDLLTSRYGYNSLGLEGYYGHLSSRSFDEQRKEIVATVGDTHLKPRAFTIQTKSGSKKIEILEADIFHDFGGQEYEVFVKEKRVPTYGIEDRDTHLASLIFHAYRAAINGAHDVANLIASQEPTQFKVPAPIFREVEGYMKQLRKRQPLMGLPAICLYEAILVPYLTGEKITDSDAYTVQHKRYHDSIDMSCPRGIRSFEELEELVQERILYEQEFRNFDKAWRVRIFRSRTRKMAENIPKYMEGLGSTKGIVIAGATHVFTQIGQQGKIHKYTIPHLLPYSSLAINATGVNARL